jgi:glycosyltransferase involved in cell wall biosynthesis
LEQRKGQERFLQVFQRIALRVPQAVLLLVGEGPDRARLQEVIQRLGLQGRVIFTGFRTDLERVLQIAHVGVLSSTREGLPRVIIQYALAGLPTVATDIPGVREVIQSGVDGFTVPPQDLNGMEEPLVHLLIDGAFRASLVGQLRSRDFSAWSLNSMIEKLEALYERHALTCLPQPSSPRRALSSSHI